MAIYTILYYTSYNINNIKIKRTTEKNNNFIEIKKPGNYRTLRNLLCLFLHVIPKEFMSTCYFGKGPT